MYSPYLCDQFDKGYNECEEDEGFKSSEDELGQSDREEIEQALYAQIHYCQEDGVEDGDLKYDFNYSENGQIIYNRIQLEDKQFSVKSPSKSKKKSKSKTSIDRCKAESHKTKSVSKEFTISKAECSKKDEVILLNSPNLDTELIDSKFSGSEAEIIDLESSDFSVGDLDSDYEIDISSDIDYDIDSDCMMLDEDCDDMEDIVLNINDDQRKMVKNLTVRNIKEQDDADKWKIIDQDRFTGNPLIRRYHRPLSVRCHNCNEFGHLSKVCPQPKKEIVCYLCGEEGHNGRFCKNPVCYNCNKPGHIAADCTGPWRSRYTECHRCQMLGHTVYECPELWRQFHMTTVHGELIRGNREQNARKHCSNCAAEDHFDFECEEERMDRHSLPSYPFIAQYRKKDMKAAKRHRDINEDNISHIPSKRRKIDEDFKRSLPKIDEDFKRNLPEEIAEVTFCRTEKHLNGLNKERKNRKKKKKFQEKEKKEENFRKMMDMDESTFRDNRRSINKKENTSRDKKKKNKKKTVILERGNSLSVTLQKENLSNSRGKKKTAKKKKVILERGNNLSVTLEVSKKKKKKSKKNKKDKKKTGENSNKGFKIRNGYFKKS